MALDFPNPPLTNGQTYIATNGITYTWDATISVWTAATTAALSVTAGSISGGTSIGSVLTYTPGTASGGIPNTTPPPYTITQQWYANGVAIFGETGTTYTVATGDQGKAITVEITATDSVGSVATATTAPIIIPAAVPLSVTAGTISGTPAVGQLLTYTQGIASGGLPPVTRTQEWFVNGVGTGNNTLNYTVAPGDAGKAITVTITATDSILDTATATTTPVNIPGPLSIANAGTITGVATSGSTLTYSVGSAAGGTAPYVYAWVWKKASDNSTLQTGGTTYRIPNTLIGDRVYVTLTATDFATATASGNTAGYPNTPALIVAGAFPNSSFTPAAAPNASPASVSTGSLNGTASCSNWQDGAVSLSSTGGIQFRVNGGAYVTNFPGPIANGNTVDVIWDPAVISAAADNAVLSGTLTDGFSVNTYTMTVTRSVNPASFIFPAIDPVALNSANTSSVVTPTGFNVPVTLSIAGAVSNPMTGIGSQVATGGFSSAAKTVNPGQTIQLQGIAGGTTSTNYGIVATIGSAAINSTWLTKTVSALPAITAPTILTPSAGSTGQGSATGITITASSYVNLNGAGSPQTSSLWQVYKNSYPLGPSTATIGAVNPGTPGTPGTVQYKTSASADTPSATYQDEVYGDLATTAGNNSAHPMFQWAAGLSIDGFTDWYIPSKNELDILYFNLKPTTTSNNTVNAGVNPNAVPPRASNYTASVPGQTSVLAFRTGAVQAFQATTYWNSTEASVDTTAARTQSFNTGAQTQNAAKTNLRPARAIRRIPIAEYTAAGSPAIGTYLKGGYYGGKISTAGNGVADYALIVAPNPQGSYGDTGGTNASLTIAGANTDGFVAGMTIKGNTSNATGIIISVNSTTIEYLPTSGTFVTGETISTDPASYTAVTGSPFNKTTGTLTSLSIARPPLESLTKYWVRAQYATTNATATTSAFGPWSDFTTGQVIPGNSATLLASVGGSGAVQWNGSRYVLSGDVTNPGVTRYSSDLVNWTTTTQTNTNNTRFVTLCGGNFVLGAWSSGNNGATNFRYSSDGITWSNTASSPNFINQAASFIVVNSSTVLLASPNQVGISSNSGASFSSSYSGTSLVSGNSNISPGSKNASTPAAVGGVSFGGLYVMTAKDTSNDYIITSSTGLSNSWSIRRTTSDKILGYAKSSTSVVAVGTVIARSTNGTSWSTVYTPPALLRWVAYNSGVYVAVGASGTVVVSVDDGLTWVDKTSSVNLPSDNFRGVNYVNSKWIMNTATAVYQLN